MKDQKKMTEQGILRIFEMRAGSTSDAIRLGKTFSAEIRRNSMKKFQGIRQALKATVGIELTKDRYDAIIGAYLDAARSYSPELVDEVHGFAEGSEVDPLDVFSLNCYLDLNDLKIPEVWERLNHGGCTSFGLEVEQGNAIVSQTYDVNHHWLDGLFMLKVRQADGSTLLTPTVAGMVGNAGINSHGLAIMINKLTPSDSQHGVPHNFLIRRALEQRTLGEAIDIILSADRASGTHFTLCDKDGNLLGLETSAKQHAVLYPHEGYVAHTNHYLDSTLHHEVDLTAGQNGGSIARLTRIDRLLRRAISRSDSTIGAKSGIELSISALQDHAHYPMSICYHVRNSDDEHDFQSETVTAFVAIPHQLKLLVTRGHACLNDFVTYSLDS